MDKVHATEGIRQKIRVQIVEDHDIVAKGFRNVIDNSGVAITTAIFHDIPSFRFALLRSQPDVVLLDKQFKEGEADENGIDYCRELRKKYPAMKVIILTVSKNFSDITHSKQNGALGYVVKGVRHTELIACIEAVYHGEEYLSKEAQELMDKINDDRGDLSAADLLMLQWLADGNTGQEIAEKIFRSLATFNDRKERLCKKMGARNVHHLVAMAFRAKLVE